MISWTCALIERRLSKGWFPISLCLSLFCRAFLPFFIPEVSTLSQAWSRNRNKWSPYHIRALARRPGLSSIVPCISILVPVSVPLFKSISTMSGFPSRLSCPVQSVVLLSEAKANPLYCIRSSWLGWYIKHIGILLVRCGTHIFQCQSSNRIHKSGTLHMI